MVKNIDLSDLIKIGDKIDWIKSSQENKVIYFQYGDIVGSFKLISYSHSTRKCEVIYNDENFILPSNSIVKCRIGNLFIKNNEGIVCDKTIKEIRKKDDKKREYCLYCHINKYNSKKYYGITKRNPNYRWNHGKGYSNNEYFTRAIEKYGWDDGFDHIIILNNLTEKEACELEKQYIRKDRTNLREYGYNLASGGIDEMIGKTNPHAITIYQYTLNGYFLKRWDCIKDAGLSIGVENAANISRALTSKSHQAYGFLWTTFYSDKIEPYKKRKQIIQYTTDGEFINLYNNSSSIDNSKFNINKIHECCRHNISSYKGFIWLYEEEKNYISFYTRVYKYARYSNKPVAQYDLNKNHLNSYVSIYEAQDITGVPAQSIYKNCIGELKTTGYKFIWEYIECDKLKPEVMNLPIVSDNE